jgi:hypothetical protein
VQVVLVAAVLGIRGLPQQEAPTQVAVAVAAVLVVVVVQVQMAALEL